MRIPINFVTYPGVSVAKACFAQNVYEDGAAARCFSNLLASGFRRFDWDLYWDSSRRVWSFCPAQIPQSRANPESSTRTFFTPSSTTVSLVSITPRSIVPPLLADDDRHSLFSLKDLGRQVSPISASTTMAQNLSSSGKPTSTQSTSAATSSEPPGLISIGPYSCTSSIDVPVLAAVLAEYMRNSSNTIDAIITYLTLNLHVAAPSNAPLRTPLALNTSALPNPQELVSTLLNFNLSSYLYTPALLKGDRANLNASWFKVATDQSQLVYLNITRDPKGTLSTSNGWPSEEYLEFQKVHRLLAGFGQIDPQLQSYNLTGDDGTIFRTNSFQNTRAVQYGPGGNITQGCFFNADNPTILGSNNNSWAVSSQLQLPKDPASYSTNRSIPAVSNFTSCGISPFLNSTLLNATTDQNFLPYQIFVYSSIWSWASGEPHNVSSQTDNSARIRCAAFDGSLNSRWRVADCTERHYASCRVGNSPYTWRISSTKAVYSSCEDMCPDGSSFDVPKTALENRYLSNAVMQRRNEDSVIWLNFNSLDVQNCWVPGVNSSCPYRQADDVTHCFCCFRFDALRQMCCKPTELTQATQEERR